MKKVSQSPPMNSYAQLQNNKVANDLALRSRHAVLENLKLDMTDLYDSVLRLTELYLTNSQDVDSAVYEECMRAIIGNEAYQMYTVDRVVHSIQKQVSAINADDIPKSLLQIYEEEQKRKVYPKPNETMVDMSDRQDDCDPNLQRVRDQIRYRVKAEQIVGNEDRLYKIEYVIACLDRIFLILLDSA